MKKIIKILNRKKETPGVLFEQNIKNCILLHLPQLKNFDVYMSSCGPRVVIFYQLAFLQDVEHGRYLVAVRDIRPMEVVLAEPPLSWGPYTRYVWWFFIQPLLSRAHGFGSILI